ELGLRLEGDIDSMTYLSLSAKRAAEGHRRRFDEPESPGSLATAAMVAVLYEGPAERAADLAWRAWDSGALLSREAPEAPIVLMVASALLYSHDLGRAQDVASAWAQEASRRGSLRAYSLALILRNRVSLWLGDLAEAEADARAFLENWPEAIGLGLPFLAEILAEQGRLEEAERALERGPAGPAHRGARVSARVWPCRRGMGHHDPGPGAVAGPRRGGARSSGRA